MLYLLDTNICIYIANEKPTAVLERFRELRPGDAGMSIVTYMELFYGAVKSRRRAMNVEAITRLQTEISVVPLDVCAADAYATLRVELERKGTLVGAYDMQIAAHALAINAVLVTNNVREFSRVKGLMIENWAE